MEGVEIRRGDSLKIVPCLEDGSVDAVVIDPPYGERMGYEGDNTVIEAEALLAAFLRVVGAKLKRNGHLAIFWTMRNLDVCLDVLRGAGFEYKRTLSMYIPRGGARPYLGWLPRTQAIVIGQKRLPKEPTEFHREMAEYLGEAVQKSGMTRNKVAKILGCDSRLVMKWTRVGDPAWCLPTPRFYKSLKEILQLDDRFDVLLDREPGSGAPQREDLEYKHDTYVVDEKNAEDMIHPSQKPLSVLEHLVVCMAPEGGLVLDGFAGSGTTAVACKRRRRRCLAIEVNEAFCELSQRRLEED